VRARKRLENNKTQISLNNIFYSSDVYKQTYKCCDICDSRHSVAVDIREINYRISFPNSYYTVVLFLIFIFFIFYFVYLVYEFHFK